MPCGAADARIFAKENFFANYFIYGLVFVMITTICAKMTRVSVLIWRNMYILSRFLGIFKENYQ